MKWIRFFALLMLSLTFMMRIPSHASEEYGKSQDSVGMDYAAKELIVSIPVAYEKNVDGTVYYKNYPEQGYCGPTSFCVDDNGVYILDSCNCRVLAAAGDKVWTIALTKPSEASGEQITLYDAVDIAVNKDLLFAVSEFDKKVYVYTLSGEFIRSVSFPERVTPCEIAVIGGECIVFDPDSYSRGYRIDSKTFEVTGVELDCGGSFDDEQYFQRVCRGRFKDGYLYDLIEMVPDTKTLVGELVLGYVSGDGRLMASYHVPARYLDTFIWISRFYKVYDNELYTIEGHENEVNVYRITLGSKDPSGLDRIKNYWYRYEKKVNQADKLNIKNEKYVSSIGLSRTAVSARVSQMVYYPWTLTADNVNFDSVSSSSVSDVELPNYISEIVSAGSLNNGNTVTMIGIPYCWGGFESQDSSNYSAYGNFLSAINAGFVAGNICDTSTSYIYGTAGLDCSGFVCAAYGMSTKHGTSWLSTYGSAVSDITNAGFMDFLVRIGSNWRHAMLYYGSYNASTGKFGIAEANSTVNTGKTVIRSVNYSDIVAAGYQIRTPW
ncbi:MAG: hypothetical protein K6E85_01465 [Lachnospiraceae bacterium]|nr:hypothetical protein [Lachnospiraceae bacterium]